MAFCGTRGLFATVCIPEPYYWVGGGYSFCAWPWPHDHKFDASRRRGKKGLEFSRDKNEGAYPTVAERGKKSLLGDPGSELHVGRRRKGGKKRLRR